MMPFHVRSHILLKYGLIVVALVVAALIASGGTEMYFSYQESKAALFERQQEQAAFAASRIEQFMQEIERQIQWTTTWSEREMTLETRRVGYLAFLRLAPAVTSVTYIDSAGREQLRMSRVDVDVIASGTDLSADPTFTDAKRGSTSYDQVRFVDGSIPYVTIGVGGADPYVGVTVADVNLKFVSDVISSIKIGDSGRAYVVDGNGDVIAHPDRNLVLRRTSFASVRPVSAALAAAKSGTGPLLLDPIEYGPDVDGRRVVASAMPIPRLGWYVFVEQPWDELRVPLYQSIRRMALLLAIGIVLASAASFLVAANLTKPITRLKDGALTIGAGDLDHRIRVSTGDELQDVAEAFNSMAARLRELYRGLERKVQDRTRQLQEALDQLREKSEQLELASRHKSQFLANMSHELRTPLNAVIGYTELLRDDMYGELPPEAREILGRIELNGRNLLALINDVLDLSKIEAGQLQLRFDEYSLVALVQDVARIAESLALEKGLTLDIRCPADPLMGCADEQRLSQVVMNLLSNAIKFTDAGGVVVECASMDDGALYRVSVRDTGPGIAAADVERIFGEFQQGDRTTTPQKGGTGLGLAISKRIIEMHGGQIWAESELGHGATFRFVIPARVTQQVEVSHAASAHS